LFPVPNAVALETTNLARYAEVLIQSLCVIVDLAEVRPPNHHQGPRSDHGDEFLNIRVPKYSRNELAMVVRVVPVHDAHSMNQFEQIERVFYRNSKLDPFIDRRRVP